MGEGGDEDDNVGVSMWDLDRRTSLSTAALVFPLVLRITNPGVFGVTFSVAAHGGSFCVVGVSVSAVGTACDWMASDSGRNAAVGNIVTHVTRTMLVMGAIGNSVSANGDNANVCTTTKTNELLLDLVEVALGVASQICLPFRKETVEFAMTGCGLDVTSGAFAIVPLKNEMVIPEKRDVAKCSCVELKRHAGPPLCGSYCVRGDDSMGMLTRCRQIVTITVLTHVSMNTNTSVGTSVAA